MSADQIAQHVTALDRNGLVKELQHFPGRLLLDFTPAYLERLSTERLRHVLLAAHLQASKPKPQIT